MKQKGNSKEESNEQRPGYWHGWGITCRFDYWSDLCPEIRGDTMKERDSDEQQSTLNARPEVRLFHR